MHTVPTLELLKDTFNRFESSGQAAAPEETMLGHGGHGAFLAGLEASAPSVAGGGLRSCPPWRWWSGHTAALCYSPQDRTQSEVLMSINGHPLRKISDSTI